MSEARNALIIANYRYEHSDLRQLLAPAQDAESLARVLSDPSIGGFEVRTVVNEPSHKVSLEIEGFCDNRKRDDLLVLYFSGHGIKDADGQLYFATIDTQLVQQNVRRATAVSASFVNEVMSRSRSRRQILLLDCCYSGAFKEGMLAKGGKRIGAGEQLEGQGRIVLTASDALQYSFEGGQVQGQGVRSIFTRILVSGLETGEADLDRDGSFSLDEVYDYVYGKVADEQPEQRPTKMGYVEGKIFIGNNPRPIAAELPAELRQSVDNPLPWVRLGAVQQLEKLLEATSKGLALAARAALTSLANADDSQQVRTLAAKCLAAYAGLGISPEPKEPAVEEPKSLEPSEQAPEPIAVISQPESVSKQGEKRGSKWVTRTFLYGGLFALVAASVVTYLSLPKGPSHSETKPTQNAVPEMQSSSSTLTSEKTSVAPPTTQRESETNQSPMSTSRVKHTNPPPVATQNDVKSNQPQEPLLPKLPWWTDPDTGLMWANPKHELDWEEANSYCSNLRLGGYSDWHLPTITELEGICNPAPSTCMFKKGMFKEGRTVLELPFTVWSNARGQNDVTLANFKAFKFFELVNGTHSYTAPSYGRFSAFCVRGSVAQSSLP